MDVVAAKRKVLDLLKKRGKAANSTLIELLGGNVALLKVVCKELRFEDLVEEHECGLAFVGGASPAAADEALTATDIDLPSTPAQKLLIFVSYGHDLTTPFARKLEACLEHRGHKTWFDCRSLQPGVDWSLAIEDSLEKLAAHGHGRLVLLMTPYSVDRKNAYCVKEVARAVDRDIRILPVMLIETTPPLAICDIQWLDMRDCVPVGECQERFESKLPLLLNALENDALDFQGAQSRIARALKPVSFLADVERHLKRYTGRKWLIERVDAWLRSNGSARVLWITGSPGTGKTAFACWLSTKRREIRALHLCERGHRQKGDPRGIIRSVAWQLSTQLPGFFDCLKPMGDLREICEEGNAATLMDRLLIQPLHRVAFKPDKPIVIIIDALDEVESTDEMEFATLLQKRVPRFPDWIRFILTRNTENAAYGTSQAASGIDFDAHKADNLDDIRRFLEKHLRSHASSDTALSTAVTTVTKKSEGCFLYVEWIRRELQMGSLSLDRVDMFPNGLGNIYAESFQCRFPDLDEYGKTYRPVLEVIAAAHGRLDLSLLKKIFDWPPYVEQRVLDAFGALFCVRDGAFRPCHRSLLQWLTEASRSKRHWVAAKEGHRRLAEYGWREYQRNVATMSDYMKAHLPEHLHHAGERDKLIECVTDAVFVYHYGKAGFLYSLAEFWKDIDGPTLRERCLASLQSRKRLPDIGRPFLALCGLSLGRLFQQTGDYQTAMRCFERALACSRFNAGDSTPARARFCIGWCMRHNDRFDEAIATLRRAQDEFRQLGDMGGEARSLSAMGICYWHLQQDHRALRCLNEALRLFEQTNEKRHHAEALNHIGIVYRGVGRYDDALRNFSNAEALLDQIQDWAGLGKLYNSIGTALWWSGRTKKAFQQYAKADETNEKLRQPYVLGLTANNRGYLLQEMGQFDKAYREFERARSIRRHLRSKSYEMMDLSGMARAAFHAGRRVEAQRLSKQAMRGLAAYSKVEDLRRAYYNHYLIFEDSEEPQEAIGALRKAKHLVNERLRHIGDQALCSSFVRLVPLVKDILTAKPPPDSQPDQVTGVGV